MAPSATTLKAQARYLGTMLTADSGVWVVVRYSPWDRQYAIMWVGGPTAADMFALALHHAAQVPDINLRTAILLRTEPTST